MEKGNLGKGTHQIENGKSSHQLQRMCNPHRVYNNRHQGQPPMQESMPSPHSPMAPSVWVKRFLPLINPGGLVLDLAAGSGRHVRLLRDCGFAVCAVDRNTTALLAFAGPCCEVRRIDLETDNGRQLGDDYDGIIVTDYLHRPLLSGIARKEIMDLVENQDADIAALEEEHRSEFEVHERRALIDAGAEGH